MGCTCVASVTSPSLHLLPPHLAVGGAPDRVTVVPVVDGAASEGESCRDSLEQFKSQLTHFDVAQAKCAKDEDTQRLLACIVSAARISCRGSHLVSLICCRETQTSDWGLMALHAVMEWLSTSPRFHAVQEVGFDSHCRIAC